MRDRLTSKKESLVNRSKVNSRLGWELSEASLGCLSLIPSHPHSYAVKSFSGRIYEAGPGNACHRAAPPALFAL